MKQPPRRETDNGRVGYREPLRRTTETTFSGEAADRHPPTGPTTDEAGVEHPGKEGVRLLTWGDPYLTAWPEPIRGEPLKEADYVAAGLAPEANPMRQTRREQP